MIEELRLEGVSKRFGSRLALDRAEAAFQSGDLVLLLGPNGSGKTTLLRLLATLSPPSAGRILANGQDIQNDLFAYRRQVGAAWDQEALYLDLTLRENIAFFAGLNGLRLGAGEIAELLERLEMTAQAEERVRLYSHGMRKKASLVVASLGSPCLRLFDEPETGLDEKSLGLFLSWLRRWREARDIVIIATHCPGHYRQLATHRAVLDGGRLSLLREER